jgi:hypothetical protein
MRGRRSAGRLEASIDGRAVDVQVSGACARRAITAAGSDPIRTVRGSGYSLDWRYLKGRLTASKRIMLRSRPASERVA